jgi:S-adenosylmethionine:tRNA ribosyltransferase-isomerase
MRITELDYHLPAALIATAPAVPRDASRLMVVRSANHAANRPTIGHHHFHNLPTFLRAGDLLIVNQTRVLPARLSLRRRTGAIISGLFLKELHRGEWEVLLRTRGKVKIGDTLTAPPYAVELRARREKGLWHVRITPADPAAEALERIGHIPLPPYISRQRRVQGDPEETPADRASYQTVYAQPDDGQSVAAPTAGLHFTPELLAQLETRGILRAPISLDVGMGTFLPVETETLEEHPMHEERYQIPAATVAALRHARAENRRIIAVGTTAVRTLESAAERILDLGQAPQDLSGSTRLLIAPGFRFQLTGALITNFHLPRSTLMALVGAFLEPDGIRRLKEIYGAAVAAGYRFYSYGDAMLIE